MNKIIAKIIASVMLAIIYGLMVKYTNIEIAILCVLIQIYIELLLRGDINER